MSGERPDAAMGPEYWEPPDDDALVRIYAAATRPAPDPVDVSGWTAKVGLRPPGECPYCEWTSSGMFAHPCLRHSCPGCGHLAHDTDDGCAHPDPRTGWCECPSDPGTRGQAGKNTTPYRVGGLGANRMTPRRCQPPLRLHPYLNAPRTGPKVGLRKPGDCADHSEWDVGPGGRCCVDCGMYLGPAPRKPISRDVFMQFVGIADELPRLPPIPYEPYASHAAFLADQMTSDLIGPDAEIRVVTSPADADGALTQSFTVIQHGTPVTYTAQPRKRET